MNQRPNENENENENENFCAFNPTPRPCTKHLGIKRVDMPQINNHRDYSRLKQIVNKVLHLNSNHENVNIYDNIYASQKEINTERANKILNYLQKKKRNTCQKRKQPIPVILLKQQLSNDSKPNYLVMDGHHRWLAHHLARKIKSNTKHPLHQMKSYVIHVKNDDLLQSFQNINKALKKDKHLFHKRHTFKTTKPIRKSRRNTMKRILDAL